MGLGEMDRRSRRELYKGVISYGNFRLACRWWNNHCIDFMVDKFATEYLLIRGRLKMIELA